MAIIVGENVPDYRGVFLRGYGSVQSNHFGLVTHQSNSLGVFQGDSIRNITGYVGISQPSSAYTSGAFTKGANTGVGWYADVYGGTLFDASRVVPVSNENRPVNRAVIYIIKAQ